LISSNSLLYYDAK